MADLPYLVRIRRDRRAAWSGVIAFDAGMLTHSPAPSQGRSAGSSCRRGACQWQEHRTFRGPMLQIQLPKRGLSMARAPTGATTKIDSNVHIVVAN